MSGDHYTVIEHYDDNFSLIIFTKVAFERISKFMNSIRCSSPVMIEPRHIGIPVSHEIDGAVIQILEHNHFSKVNYIDNLGK